MVVVVVILMQEVSSQQAYLKLADLSQLDEILDQTRKILQLNLLAEVVLRYQYLLIDQLV